MPFPERRRQRGNIVAMMMAMVAMMGVAAVAGVNMLSGPITTASKVTNQNMAQNDLLMNAKVVVMNAATRPNGGDEDEDGYIEPAPFIPTSEESCNITLPGEGGCLPMDIGAIQTDPWGTQYAYCVWDHGTETGSENRIAGEDSTSGAVIAIISAGPNKQFETPCLPYDGDPETNDIGINPDGLGDDLVQIFTYAGAVSGSGGLWELKQGEPTTAVTAKDVEVDGAFRMGFAGEDPGQVGLASCTDMNHIGRMRFNPLDKAIEVCVFNGNYGWETLSGSGGSGGSALAPSGFPDVIMCNTGSQTNRAFYYQSNHGTYLQYAMLADATAGRFRIEYNTDGSFRYGESSSEDCVSNAWSISQLKSMGRTRNIGGSTSSSGSTMVPGWPDAIVCNGSGGSDGKRILFLTFSSNSGTTYRRVIPSTSDNSLSFDSSGNYSSHAGMTSYDCMSESMSISDLYSNGQAFNLVGGGSAGSGLNVHFRATGAATSIPTSAWTRVVNPTVLENVDDGYNPATGRFTAPASGVYAFSATTVLLSMSANRTGIMIETADSGAPASGRRVCHQMQPSTSQANPSCAGTIWLDSGESVAVAVYQDSGSSISLPSNSQYTLFAGALVGGGGSGGSGAEGVDATGMIVAFASDTCPAGWSEYTPARGRFLRGIDPTGTNDAVRAAGHVQNDELGSHTHTGTTNTAGAHTHAVGESTQRRDGGATGAPNHYGAGNTSTKTSGSAGAHSHTFTTNATGGTETRPKNVAVTFCRFDGEGVLLGGGAGGEGDNLGDHTATQNLDLSVNKLVGEGGTDGIYINSDGNVGIGTSAPIGGLTVKRTVALGEPGQIVIDRPAGTFGFIDYRSDGVRRWHMGVTQQPETGNESGSNFYINRADDDGNWIDTPFVIARNTGNVGIGTGNPAGPLHVELGASGTGSIIVTDSTAPGGALRMGEGTSAANSFFPTVQGLPAGGNSLYTGFFSSITPENDTGSAPVMVFTSRQVPSAAITTRRAFQWRNNATNLMTIDANGNVGIGTNAPQHLLHVDGGAKFTATLRVGITGDRVRFWECASGGGCLAIDDPSGTRLVQLRGDGSANYVRGANFGVGLHNPTHLLHVDGVARSAQANFATSSDLRVKEDVQQLSEGLETIMSLNPVSFRYTDTYIGGNADMRGLKRGFIAQEVENILPEMVSHVSEDVGDEELSDFRMLSNSDFVPVLVKAVQQLKTLIDQLAERLDALFERVAELLSRTNAQDSRIAELEAANDNFRRELDELKAMIAE